MTIDAALGEPYLAETIPLPDDDEGLVEATLVRLGAALPTSRAVLHLHGFADYFFQTEYAEWWTSRGYDFYALDLRKYGRSLRPHQTPNFAADLTDYYPELDEAWRRIVSRDAHTEVILAGHSTGGLLAPLWAHDRRAVVGATLTGLVLNSPWLDLQMDAVQRVAVTAVVERLGGVRPKLVFPRNVPGLYGRSLHREHEGEWEFDVALKPLASFPVTVGWLRAIRRGHARVHAGLAAPAPILVLHSDASGHPSSMDDDAVRTTDIVLDVEQIHRWATSLGPHVTAIAIPGAVHDVVLSSAEPRARAYAEIDTWLDAYVED